MDPVNHAQFRWLKLAENWVKFEENSRKNNAKTICWPYCELEDKIPGTPYQFGRFGENSLKFDRGCGMKSSPDKPLFGVEEQPEFAKNTGAWWLIG
ncbi:MAG: hypothetical protein ABJO41_05780 [Erythrobacter sp.]